MSTLLVTGVAGFIGSRLAELILESTEPELKDCLIVGVDKLGYSGLEENMAHLKSSERFQFLRGDISDYQFVRDLYHDFKIETTINVAAESHVDNSIKDPLIFVRSNTLGTTCLLDAHLASKARRFLQVSTDEVYGSISHGSWDENFPLGPRSPYSASKAGADLMVQAFHATHQMDSVITRCCNNYGPRQFPEKVIPLIITNLLTGREIPLYGDGSNRREWIHVDDHCQGIIDTLLKGESGHIHHITSETEFTNKELAQKICTLMNKDFNDVVVYVEDRKGHDFRYALDDQLTRNLLGSRTLIDFQTGLEKTINWYESNEDWWRPLVRK